MVRLSFIRIRQRRSSEPRLFPPDIPFNSLPVDEPDASGPLEANDFSYEDALLDRQIANLLRSEYGGAQVADPQRNLSVVLRAVERDKPAGAVSNQNGEVLTSGARPSLASLSGAFYRLVSGLGATRLVPGGVALMLLVAVFGADVASVLRGMSAAGGARDYLDSSLNVGVDDDVVVHPRPVPIRQAVLAGYDKVAVLQADPPETFAPPQRSSANYYRLNEQWPVFANGEPIKY